MKVYLASSFSLIPKIEEVAAMLEHFGVEITVKWWKRLQLKQEFTKLSPEEFYAHPECKFAFERDYMGIQEADALILVADETPRRYNGANIELGIAYALGKPTFSIGVLENSALYYKVKRCKDTDELLGELRKLSNKIEMVEAKCGKVCSSLLNYCNDCVLAGKEPKKPDYESIETVGIPVAGDECNVKFLNQLDEFPQTKDEFDGTWYTCPKCHKFSTKSPKIAMYHLKECGKLLGWSPDDLGKRYMI